MSSWPLRGIHWFYLVSPSQHISLFAFCAPPNGKKLLQPMSVALYPVGPNPYGIPRFPIAGHGQRSSWLQAMPAVFLQLCLNSAFTLHASCSQLLTRAPLSWTIARMSSKAGRLRRQRLSEDLLDFGSASDTNAPVGLSPRNGSVHGCRENA